MDNVLDAVYDLWPCRNCGHESYLHEHEEDDQLRRVGAGHG